MTTDYPEDTRSVECPILRRCLRRLRKKMASTFDDGGVEVLIALMERCRGCPATSGHVCLRGFLIIEHMLSHIQEMYDVQYKLPHSPSFSVSLKGRTWEQLTETRLVLKNLCEEVKLELAENQLGGFSYELENVVLVRHRTMGGADVVDTALRSTLANKLFSLSSIAEEAIITLRPRLRNEGAPVAVLGDYAAHFIQEVHGNADVTQMMIMTSKLADVRL